MKRTYKPYPQHSELPSGHSTVFARHKSDKTSANFRPCLCQPFEYLVNRDEQEVP
jgi:hypothetical protein